MHRKSFLTIPRTHKMGDLPYLVEIAISRRVPPRAVRILSSAVRMLSSTVRMLPITVRMLPVTVRIFPIAAHASDCSAHISELPCAHLIYHAHANV